MNADTSIEVPRLYEFSSLDHNVTYGFGKQQLRLPRGTARVLVQTHPSLGVFSVYSQTAKQEGLGTQTFPLKVLGELEKRLEALEHPGARP